MHVLSCVQLFVTLWTVAHQAPLSMGFYRQEYWSGLPFPSIGDLPDPALNSHILCLLHNKWILYVSHWGSPLPLRKSINSLLLKFSAVLRKRLMDQSCMTFKSGSYFTI